MYEVTPICGQIHLGKQGENLARKVCFSELSAWKKTFGEGKCELIHQRSGDTAPYPVVLAVEGDDVHWEVSATDTSVVGNGKCELRYVVGDTVVKSKTWVTTVHPALEEATAEAPDPAKSWVDQVLTAAEDVKSATTHQPTIGENGNWYVWDAYTKSYYDSGICAKGSFPEVDTELSDTSENPVQNKVVLDALNQLVTAVSGLWDDLCPLRTSRVDMLPNSGNAGVVYIHGGIPKIYAESYGTVGVIKCSTAYNGGGGPAIIYVKASDMGGNDFDAVPIGTTLYWCGTAEEPTSTDDLVVYATVTGNESGATVTPYGSVTLSATGLLQIEDRENATANWETLTPDTDLTPYVRVNDNLGSILFNNLKQL